MKRSATRLWNLMENLEARAKRHGKAVCGGRHGVSFKGAYRTLMNQAAIQFERLPYEQRHQFYVK